ncbi:hypothetical protein QJS66_00005 [Kocuria rhizophila]|nr:hypothetical protein QJS66_00005 [Kocuria rhizophila]
MTDGVVLARVRQPRFSRCNRHHRRGPRALAQHRLPAGLPPPAAATAAGPEGHHHLRDHRPAALRRALRAAAPRAPGCGSLPRRHRGLRARLPVEIRCRHAQRSAAGTAVRTRRTPGTARRTRTGTRSTPCAVVVELSASRAGTSSCLRGEREKPRRAGRAAEGHRLPPFLAGTQILPLSGGCPWRSRTACSRRPPTAGIGAGHQRGGTSPPRSPASSTWSIPARLHLAVLGAHQGPAPAHRRISQASAKQRSAAPGAPRTACASGCTRRRTSAAPRVHGIPDPAHQPGRGDREMISVGVVRSPATSWTSRRAEAGPARGQGRRGAAARELGACVDRVVRRTATTRRRAPHLRRSRGGRRNRGRRWAPWPADPHP